MVLIFGVSTSCGVLQKNAELGARGECALQEGHLRHGLFLGVRLAVWRHPRSFKDEGRLFGRYNSRTHLQENVSKF